MAEIIPAINAETFQQVKRQIEMVEPYAQWVHLDVADGTFTPNSLWHNPEDLLGLDTKLNIEVHLMISDIDTRFAQWLLSPVKRVIFHLEADHDPMFVFEKIKEAGKEAGIAILPETDWRKTEPFFSPPAGGKADSILLLAVSPGFAGQGMNKNTISKIGGLHGACQSCIIEIDGGVNADNASNLIKVGASRLVAASAIFGKPDIKKAIEELNEVIKL